MQAIIQKDYSWLTIVGSVSVALGADVLLWMAAYIDNSPAERGGFVNEHGFNITLVQRVLLIDGVELSALTHLSSTVSRTMLCSSHDR